ncbi:MAG: primosomal protein N' [Oscillatoriales cyanobacterium]|uniref:primosomal protein N' n=1 Tax=unclassified Microcoleus TaxID=2642155 RepID=UPI001D53B7ED|nr:MULTISPECIES: primosomal protein N' [unclassified Microcoleus]TAE54245.1 MAG: primosomal protein N' [Oscillatoriales cyanobacterium]MCC3445903.1 primosomal protein N' [Microcoleus sp. PH2017_09_SFU_O_A]MCC3626946.1 primosomal protein N' [Microcoleus sp. PH2017_39_LGB_O_B]MCC3639148.1 primosomal protein N' [Microcoleus sp. PH2017_33_LGB_O_A]TAF92699.1 MAG: primosomal protein N' [Oscillatoriales cyanobacterium]
MSTVTFGLLTPSAAEAGASYGSSQPPQRPTTSAQWIEVLVDSPFRGAGDSPGEENKLFTYRLPAELNVQPGDILSVPFGSQQVGAIAIRFVSQLPADLDPGRVKDVEDVVSTGFFPPTYWQLLERVSAYYCTTLIQVIRASLPPGLLSRSVRRIRLIKDAVSPNAETFLNPAASQILQLLQAQKKGDYTWQYLQRQVKGSYRGLKDLLQRGWVESYLEPPNPPKPQLKPAVILIPSAFVTDLTKRQQEVLEVLRRGGGEMWMNDLLRICSAGASVVKNLEQKGSVVIDQREVLRGDRGIAQLPDAPKTLTRFQAEALGFINSFSGFRQVLLHGVTGSGKTEVYLQAIAPILASGKSALVLVPEIGLTPQLTDRFRARFGEQICVYHSGLSDGERYDTWRQMLTGTPQIVIGTRSAIFAPLPHLGLIILDEEHDSSFKQDQPAPCYHARTVAKWRAELENCPLILGSATPALETLVGTRRDYHSLPTIHYLSLPTRVYSRPMPPVEVVDMRQELRQGNRSIFSTSLQNALEQLQARQQQGILFIHRRGHSTFVSCRSCGYVMECPNCDVSLSYHQVGEGTAEILRCHYCNHTERHPQNCPECSSPYFKNFGSGTQRVEQELTRLFPELRAIRFDSDTTRNKGDHRRLLTQFANGEADILLGTQMLTKGLDLAQVTLVGVVSADGLLNLSDYRASERAFQTLTQVAGRAGRGDDPGRVIIQTYTPEHRVVQAVRRHEYTSFVETELAERAALNYPPSGRLILLRLSSVDAAEVAVTAVQLASVCQQYIDRLSASGCEMLGPAPAAIMRVANRYRWQILLKLPLDESLDLSDLVGLRDSLRDSFASRTPRSVSLTIDVDPLNFG